LNNRLCRVDTVLECMCASYLANDKQADFVL